jgi:hypothetical protein
MNPPVAMSSRHRPNDDRNELACGLDSMALPFLHNGSRNPTRISFFAILENDVRELVLLTTVHQIRSSRSGRLIHTHVQRAIKLKTKSSRCVIELRRRNPKIEEHTVNC